MTAAYAIRGAIASQAERSARVKGRFGHLLDEVPPGLNYSFFTEQMGHPNPIFSWRSKFSDFLYKADPNAPIRTLKAQGGQYTGPFHWDNRPFSVGELKRLQTFPDAYEIIGRRQIAIHQIGNSVPPQAGRILAIAILNQLFDVKLPVELPVMEESETLGFRQRKRSLTAIYRAKAKAAIGALDDRKIASAVEGRTYTATLAEDFAWQMAPKQSGKLKVEFAPQKNQWSIRVAPLAESAEGEFRLDISAVRGTSWGLKVPKVLLYGSALTREVFTGVWKAFEVELARFHIKADLVQLCGYYQYKPILSCTMALPDAPNIAKQWTVLKYLVEGKGVGSILPMKEIAAAWDIPVADVLGVASWLRTLGYEVRNRHTNPQIPEKHLLVPYIFPTLNPLSVQLRKSLLGVPNGAKE